MGESFADEDDEEEADDVDDDDDDDNVLAEAELVAGVVVI